MDIMEGMEQLRSDNHSGALDALLESTRRGWRSETQVREAQQRREVAIEKAATIFENAKRHPYGELLIREAFSTSDFQLAFTWFTDRVMLANYETMPAVWDQFMRRTTVSDFRVGARDRMQGLDDPMQEVHEGENYQNDSKLVGSRLTPLQVKKYGRQFPISFESAVNDVLGQLADIPKRLAEAARVTEQKLAAKAYAANGTLYTTQLGNKGTAKLSVDALSNAITAMQSQNSSVSGSPINVRAAILVVPRQLEITAQRILEALLLTFDTNPSAGTAKVRYETPNYLKPRLQLVVDPYLDIADPTNGTTGWYLFADPNKLAAAEVGFLRGYEKPKVSMKAPDQQAINDDGSLAALNWADGAFDNDGWNYRVRHITGAAAYEPKATYWSDGTV